jgi:hypothetical protein
MTLVSGVRAESFRERLRSHWSAFSRTLIGDLIATAIAILLMSVSFLVCTIATIELSHALSFVFGHIK